MSLKKKFATYGALGTLAAGAIYAINKGIYFSSTLENLLSSKNGEFYEWRFGHIYYTKKGKGKPILLVHDLSSSSSAYEWNKIINALSKTNTVYAIDLLGCGRSEKPDITYTNFLYVQIISDFIKHIIGEKTDVVVTGESSPLVLMSCHYDHSIIDKIIMINPTDLVSLSKVPTKRTRSLKVLLQIPLIGTLLYNMLMSKTKIDREFDHEYFYDAMRVEDTYVNTYYESAHIGNAKPKYLFSSMKGRFTNANILQCLKSVNNSIFIIVGNGDSNYRLIAEQYKTYTPAIEIAGISKTKRLPQLERPNKVIDQIKLFFEIED